MKGGKEGERARKVRRIERRKTNKGGRGRGIKRRKWKGEGKRWISRM